MAKAAKAEPNLSELVREVLKEQPELKPAQVVEHLKSKGIEVKVGLVNAVKAAEKKKAMTTQTAAANEFLQTGKGKNGKATKGDTVGNGSPIGAIKALVAAIGKDGVKEIIDLM